MWIFIFSFSFSDEIIIVVEQIIEAVLQGQTKSAPIERIVDAVTAYFAISTWIVG